MSNETSAPAVPVTPRPGPLKRLYLWVLGWADTPYGVPALFVLSFMESSFFPIPPDVLQIALSTSKPKRSFFYAAVSTVASVLGGVFGWWLGLTFWAQAQGFFFEYVPGFTPENFESVRVQYDENAFLAIFTAAFTPIPYKIFTLASGALGVSLGVLVVASIFGRGGRFFIVATAIYFFGPTVRGWLDKYLNLITIGLLVAIVLGFACVKWLM
jgi:membrane protein YqaA with SNARE-associated domain